MWTYILRLSRHILPQGLKRILKGLKAYHLMSNMSWNLPPFQGLVMKGPGVYGTYVERPYELEVCQTLMHWIQPGWVCVDVGAHLGYFTLAMAHLVGETGKVFAFEALPENVRWLRENVAINGFTQRVTVENLAVTDGRQPAVRLNAPLHYTSEWSIVRPSPIHRFVEVQATCLDRYFASGPKVDFIKVDIEGAEHLALQGSCHIIRRDRPLWLIELHGEEGRMAVSLLLEMGYRIEDMQGQPLDGPPFPRHILARPEGK